jgi:hypothetical protein
VSGRSPAQAVLSGYDFPIRRDWLAWAGLLAVAVVGVFEVRANGAWALLGAPILFALFGWIAGACRNIVRGYRANSA